jgi:putative membrane protein (TIGR04086 family)
MTYIKNLGIAFGFIIGSLFGVTLIVTLLHYINWIGSKTLSVLEIITPLLSLFIGGFIIGKNSKQKGWLEGLKLGCLFLTLLILFQYLGLRIHFSVKTILFYALLLVSCVFGSMLGINKRAKEK